MPRYVIDIPDDLPVNDGDYRGAAVQFEDALHSFLQPHPRATEIKVYFVPRCDYVDFGGQEKLPSEHLEDLKNSHYVAKSFGTLGGSADPASDSRRVKVSPLEPHNLISSELKNVGTESPEYHTPLFDVDIPIVVIPSKTPGHNHVSFPSRQLSWTKYEDLLVALVMAGIVEEGYLGASRERRATYIRAYPTPSGFKNDEVPDDWGKVPSA